MTRLTRYLKPYTLMILLAVVLLFVQANADLALPDYLSRIVNVGIQQGGVERALPDAMRTSTLERLALFLDDADKTALLAQYTLVNATSPDYAALVKTYPALADEPLYILGDVDAATVTALTPPVSQAWLAVSVIEQIMADPAKAAQMGGGMGGFDLTKLPAGTDLFKLLTQLPAAQRTQMKALLQERFAALGESMVTQAALRAVKAEYAALGVDAEKLQTAYILRVGAQMLLVTLLSVACTITVGLLAARTSAGLARDLRRAVFEKVEGFSGAEFDKFSTASLITRTTNDVTQVQMVTMMMVRMVIYAPIMGVGGIIRAVSKGSSMWWLIAVAVAFLMSLIAVVFSIALPKFKSIQKLVDRLNLVAREQLSGMMVIRAFNRQDFEEARFDKANVDLTAVSLFINRVMVIMMPVIMFIMNGLSLAIIWVGAHQVAEATMQVGDMMAFLQYAMQIVMSFLMLTMMFIMLPRAAVSGDRIADVLETEASIHDPAAPHTFPTPFKGTVEFRDVGFRYPGAEENVLCGITFTAQPGQTTAIVGSTGSGKSTVVNLIPRFYDVTEGAILIDGVDIRHVAQHDLRDKIGYIPQRGMLFSGDIESNLRYADEDADEETLRWAAEVAQASEFIDAKPEGLAAEIAQGGTNVSGGQKQRLAIARALVKKPPIYIFDDSFSALDFKTDAALRRALKQHTGDSTLLIVTQRVATIKNAEQIIVLEEGQMVGKGTHHELMETCPTYREIALSQLSMEELA
ncbi:MAG TPA: ABC transporter ATP-binding protein [Anaerolineae bacterium]|nr:ABC transporter ATP-binding protein [Anaerolineae bacterium]HQI83649.1 ABC transporter ATP-binding protein [Anaerolineae bacterium]